MATTLANLKSRLNVWLRDGSDRTWTSAEKDELLVAAIADPYAYKVVRDTSLSTITSTYSYTAPSGIESIYELGLDADGNGIFHALPRDAYDLIGGTIYFTDTGLPSGKTIQIVGKSKLTTSTTDFPTNVQEYILHLACAEAFEMLKTSLTSRFLKNDITMSEIVQSIGTHRSRANELKQSIANQRLVTL